MSFQVYISKIPELWTFFTKWFFYRAKIVCEDSEALLARAKNENPDVEIPEPQPKPN